MTLEKQYFNNNFIDYVKSIRTRAEKKNNRIGMDISDAILIDLTNKNPLSENHMRWLQNPLQKKCPNRPSEIDDYIEMRTTDPLTLLEEESYDFDEKIIDMIAERVFQKIIKRLS